MHGILLHGLAVQISRMSLASMGWMGTANLVGAAIYAARVCTASRLGHHSLLTAADSREVGTCPVRHVRGEPSDTARCSHSGGVYSLLWGGRGLFNSACSAKCMFPQVKNGLSSWRTRSIENRRCFDIGTRGTRPRLLYCFTYMAHRASGSGRPYVHLYR